MMEKSLVGTKVLLLEGFARQSMPMMEALHKNGYHVTTYNASKLDMGYVSRYPDKKIIRFANHGYTPCAKSGYPCIAG